VVDIFPINKKKHMQGPIYQKTTDFSIKVIGLYRELTQNQEYVISKQVLRSGTSIGANVNEAASAQSKKDFISKMSIALKEAKETRYWLIILSEGGLAKRDLSSLKDEIEVIIKLLSKIIITTKNNLNL